MDDYVYDKVIFAHEGCAVRQHTQQKLLQNTLTITLTTEINFSCIDFLMKSSLIAKEYLYSDVVRVGMGVGVARIISTCVPNFLLMSSLHGFTFISYAVAIIFASENFFWDDDGVLVHLHYVLDKN